ncbi:hypothetical protein NL676_001273 [Syzygium grande]|nr:hypothetical protein NL676_001273 [Syzygium grande]
MGIMQSLVLFLAVLLDGIQVICSYTDPGDCCGFTSEIRDELSELSNKVFLALSDNCFVGSLPPSLGKLSQLFWLDLAGNQFSGTIPVSTDSAPGLDLLLDAKHFRLNKNLFSGSIPEKLFSADMKLTHLVLDNNQLGGPIPLTLGLVLTLELEFTHTFSGLAFGFSFRNLAYNSLTGLFPDLSKMESHTFVDLSNNYFSPTDVPDWLSNLPWLSTLYVLVLLGNPVCNNSLANTSYCQPPQQPATSNYSTSLAHCGNNSCPHDHMLSPQSCNYNFPYQGKLYFIAPSFREINVTLFRDLEESLQTGLHLAPRSVFLENPFFNIDNYLEVQVAPFLSPGNHFNGSEITRIGLDLSSQICKPPQQLGPYHFMASRYAFNTTLGI